MQKLNLIILSDSKNYANNAIYEAAEKRGHFVEIVSPNDFVITLDRDGKTKLYVRDEDLEGKKIDAIIPRLGTNRRFGIPVLQFLINHLDIYSTGSPEGLDIASNKLRTALTLCKAKIPIPTTTTIRKADNFDFLIQSVGGLPAVMKFHFGSQGDGVFILNDALQSSVALRNLRTAGFELLLQRFVHTAKENEKKSDIRCWVVGNKVVAAFKRFSTHADFRSNYSLSHEGETVSITDQEERIALAAARALKLDICGVDIARDINNANAPLVYEVNGCADLKGIQKVTGINVAEKIIQLVETKVSLKQFVPKDEQLTPYDTPQKYFGVQKHKFKKREEVVEREGIEIVRSKSLKNFKPKK